MREREPRSAAIRLLRHGVANAEVARRLRVPVATVGTWKQRDRQRYPAAYPPVAVTAPRRCPRCHGSALARRGYAYLLGLYLGDGCLTGGAAARRKGVWALRIACAEAWPGLMSECAEAMRTVMPANRVCFARAQGMRSVTSYSKHWPCLFPQHGPGKKHEREIVLADWQRDIVEELPGAFARGLIHSDGCRITNWTVKLIGGERKRYEHPRYLFTNKSTDILGLYCEALDLLAVEWRRAKPDTVSVARREAVARLDRYVGPKY